ncbi:AraC family transcriptional regulator [Leptospira sp. 201903070]|uniref:AraC family transcriptional regulator n=2 Tax=Leptospira ainlahdjerensis TaxID=2810033 RepID=A0ABS2U9V7_9LEPT|nr:helix-turn-helix domain-containing protein [Leptospira ainlahdjerensis]MBM9577152.1 AraC family transcriptional regulator [Leptospira ainlahdjerensis]
MSYDLYFACSIQYIALGSIYFFKRRRSFHQKQALILILIGFNLLIFSTQNYLLDKTIRLIGDFLYSFFMIAGTIIIYTICKESFDLGEKNRTSNQKKISFTKELLGIGSIALFASILILSFWNHPENQNLPNLFVSVSEASISILILYCIYVHFFIKSFYAKRGLRLIYFLITLMLVEKMNRFLPGNFQGPAMKIGGIVYIVSPIFLFNSLIQFPFQKMESKKLPSISISSGPPTSQSTGNYYLTNMDTEKIEKKLYELLDIEKIFLDEDLRLPSVAEEMGLSTHQLSAFLNGHLQTNFNTLVNVYRVKEAMKLLMEEPSRSVISIGMAVGFNSVSTFQRAFLNLVKMSPSRYRESILLGKEIQLSFQSTEEAEKSSAISC